jgi:hypothetical protein
MRGEAPAPRTGSRLDSFIRRLEAQRACLDWAVAAIDGIPGAIVELGLGNGRTYDHLRTRFGGTREIFAFDRQVAAHPACIPDAAHLIVGDFRDTLAPFVARHTGGIALLHADIGSGDEAATAALAAFLGPVLGPMLARDAVVLSDQTLEIAGAPPQPLPPGVPPGRYFVYRAVRA